MSEQIPAGHKSVRVKQGRHGVFMYNVNDAYIGRSLDVYGEFSEIEASLFSQIVKPGMVVFDVGANIGAHTIGLAKATGAKGQVVAFEPQRVVYQMLCGNLAINGLTNVMALMAALGKKLGTVVMPDENYDQPGNFGGASAEEANKDNGGETVPLLTIDSFNFPRCEFMKVDVEGMEQDVLEGALQTLKRCNPILYVENDSREKSLPLIQFLHNAGYRLYWHLPPLFNPDNYFGVKDDIFPSLVSVNMLCLPRIAGDVAMKNFVEITAENADQYIGALT